MPLVALTVVGWEDQLLQVSHHQPEHPPSSLLNAVSLGRVVCTLGGDFAYPPPPP